MKVYEIAAWTNGFDTRTSAQHLQLSGPTEKAGSTTSQLFLSQAGHGWTCSSRKPPTHARPDRSQKAIACIRCITVPRNLSHRDKSRVVLLSATYGTFLDMSVGERAAAAASAVLSSRHTRRQAVATCDGACRAADCSPEVFLSTAGGAASPMRCHSHRPLPGHLLSYPTQHSESTRTRSLSCFTAVLPDTCWRHVIYPAWRLNFQ